MLQRIRHSRVTAIVLVIVMLVLAHQYPAFERYWFITFWTVVALRAAHGTVKAVRHRHEEWAKNVLAFEASTVEGVALAALIVLVMVGAVMLIH